MRQKNILYQLDFKEPKPDYTSLICTHQCPISLYPSCTMQAHHNSSSVKLCNFKPSILAAEALHNCHMELRSCHMELRSGRNSPADYPAEVVVTVAIHIPN